MDYAAISGSHTRPAQRLAYALRTARSRNPISAQRSIGTGQAVRYPAGREQGPGHAQRRRTYFKRTRSPQSQF